MINVGLNDMRIIQGVRGSKCRFNSITEIDSDHILRTPARGELCMAAFAAAPFEHDLVTKELRCYGRNPTKKLFGIARIILCEVLPLPAKAGRRCCFVALDLFRVGKTRYASNDGKRSCTRIATQLASYNFPFLCGSRRQF